MVSTSPGGGRSWSASKETTSPWESSSIYRILVLLRTDNMLRLLKALEIPHTIWSHVIHYSTTMKVNWTFTNYILKGGDATHVLTWQVTYRHFFSEL